MDPSASFPHGVWTAADTVSHNPSYSYGVEGGGEMTYGLGGSSISSGYTRGDALVGTGHPPFFTAPAAFKADGGGAEEMVTGAAASLQGQKIKNQLLSQQQHHSAGAPLSQQQHHSAGAPLSQQQHHSAGAPLSQQQHHSAGAPPPPQFHAPKLSTGRANLYAACFPFIYSCFRCSRQSQGVGEKGNKPAVFQRNLYFLHANFDRHFRSRPSTLAELRSPAATDGGVLLYAFLLLLFLLLFFFFFL
jgi:hypothetical protein